VVAPDQFTPGAWYVELHDGRAVQVPQGAIFSDPLSDLAFIRTGVSGLTPAQLGDSSQAVVGEPVIAIGNPLGYYLRDTVTRGIISGVGRYLPGGQFYYPFLQTDAAINPGNSGGALIDAQGDVIGITSVKLASTKVEGLGFAIPSNTVREILKQYQTTGRVSRPWLGATLSEPWQVSYGLPAPTGLTVTDVAADGPAAQAGLQVGDQILAVDGRPVHTVDELIAVLWSHSVGDSVALTIVRGGTQTQVQVTLAARPTGLMARRALQRQP
jgi:serine protease Do